MNESVKKVWTNEKVDKRELEWVRMLLSTTGQNEKDEMENLENLVEELLNDKEYQKLAISPMKDNLGNTILRGTATVTLLLLFSKMIDEEILDELLHNLFFVYHDKEGKSPLLLNYNISGQHYLSLIVTNKEIKLKKEYVEKVAECISQLANSITEDDNNVKTDVKVITSFMLRNDVPTSLKEKVIKGFTEQVAMLVYEELNGYLYEYLDLHADDFINTESELSEVIEALREML